jgi:hypothetical protein
MAKANSPVRLDAELMEEAARNGQLFHRSAAETIEYWATLGKRLQKLIDPEVLLEIQAGALQIDVKPKKVGKISSESVFGLVEERRAAGSLNHFVNREKPIYQASESYPGLLEQVEPDGTITVGRFRGGEFHPVNN